MQETYVGNSASVVQGGFNGGAVEAKYVRIDATKYVSDAYGMILSRARFSGPNNPLITENISIAQSDYAGSSITAGYENLISGEYNYSPNMYPNASFELELNQKYFVSTLGFAQESTNRRVRDMDVYALDGSDWVLIQQFRDFDAGPYTKFYDVDLIVGTDTLRFDVLSNYGNTTDTRLRMLFVFGTPVPEPTTALLFGFGLTVILSRRRRSTCRSGALAG